MFIKISQSSPLLILISAGEKDQLFFGIVTFIDLGLLPAFVFNKLKPKITKISPKKTTFFIRCVGIILIQCGQK